MDGSKEFFLRIKEEEYFELPGHLREKATVYYNDYEMYKNDPQFKALYSNYKKAKKDLEDYKFDKRHNS